VLPIAGYRASVNVLRRFNPYVLRNSPYNATGIEEREVPHGPGLSLRLTDFDVEALRYRQGFFVPCIDVLNQQMHLVVVGVLLNEKILEQEA
jgi:hypothetical protein